jgi:hypothetical protein
MDLPYDLYYVNHCATHTYTLNNDNTILICYTNLSKTSFRRRLLMVFSNESRCRSANEPQTSVYSISILSEHIILPNDTFINSLSRLSFTANIFKAKILKIYQKNDFIMVIICFFEALILLK